MVLSLEGRHIMQGYHKYVVIRDHVWRHGAKIWYASKEIVKKENLSFLQWIWHLIQDGITPIKFFLHIPVDIVCSDKLKVHDTKVINFSYRNFQ